MAQKTSRSLRNYNGACTLSGKISFGALVDQYKSNYVNRPSVLVNYIENVFFQEKIWRLLLRASLTKDGLLLRLQKNLQARSGITEASIGFL